MGKTAFIFPGQGSQTVGMGLDFYRKYDIAKEIYEKTDNILNYKLSNICFYGNEEVLKETINSQPAILATELAILEVFKEHHKIKPDFVLGHSLGEYAALYEANVLSFENTILAISNRAKYMDKATKDTKGGMLAVLNAELDIINEVIEEISKNKIISVANYNSPSQIVLTGEIKAIDEAQKLLTEKGVKRVVPLAVSGGFHGILMKGAAEDYSDFVKNLELKDAEIPVITNVDAKITTEKEVFREKMVKQIYSSVYWYQSIEFLISHGVDTFYEIGNGKVLSGLNKKISSEITTYNINNLESLNI